MLGNHSNFPNFPNFPSINPRNLACGKWLVSFRSFDKFFKLNVMLLDKVSNYYVKFPIEISISESDKFNKLLSLYLTKFKYE